MIKQIHITIKYHNVIFILRYITIYVYLVLLLSLIKINLDMYPKVANTE